MAEAEQLADRLTVFLTRWAAIRARDSGSTLADRLTRFFQQSRLLAISDVQPEFAAPEPLQDQPHLNSLETIFNCLRAPLMRARSAGAFLNVWSIASLKRDETRNATALASLFDPQICPGTGPEFLWAFLQRLRRSSTSPLPSEAEVWAGYTLRTEDYPLGYVDNRVDLSIEGHDFLLIIEVKIDAGEGRAQLRRYDDVLREKARLLGKRPALVYLSPRPSSAPAETVYATWADVVSAARQVGRVHRSDDHSLVSSLLLHFAAHAAQFDRGR